MLSLKKCKKLEGLWKDRDFKVGDWVYIEYGNPIEKTKWKENLLLEVSKNLVKANNLLHYGQWTDKTNVTLIPSTKNMLEKLPETIELHKGAIQYELFVSKHNNKYVVTYSYYYQGSKCNLKQIVRVDIDEALADMLDYLIAKGYLK